MKNKGIKRIMSIFLKTISTIFFSVLFFIACILLFYISCNVIAKLTNKRPLISLFTIVSPSMEPNINRYDIVYETRVNNEDDLKIGDVITFYSNTISTGGYTITHRIVDIKDSPNGKKFITKGDNNEREDLGSISFSNIVGKVQYIIPELGKIQFKISSKLGWIIVILIPCLGIILIDAKKLIKAIKIKKQLERIPKISEIDELREKEENKKIRELVEKADKLLKK